MNKNDKIMNLAREYVTGKNNETLRKAKMGDVIYLDTIRENGVMRLVQHIVSYVREDKIHPLVRERKIKINYELAELELSSSDEEGFN